MGRRLGRGLVVALTAGAAAFGIASAVQAAIPDAQGVIHGCYKTPNGDLRVIDPSSGGSCKNNETGLNWNQTGPTGPAGAQGPAGPQGQQGPPGPGEKIVAGEIGPDGQVIDGSGFSSFLVGQQYGNYEIDFPPGTFGSCQREGPPGPILTVTPFMYGAGRIAASVETFCDGDGRADARVLTVGADDGSLYPIGFYFMAVQP